MPMSITDVTSRETGAASAAALALLAQYGQLATSIPAIEAAFARGYFWGVSRVAAVVVALTSHEFKLLRFFTENPERVLSRELLLNEVWGYNSYPTTRTVDNQILKLRQKLEPDPANPTHLLTIYGAGYKFVP